LKRHNLYEDPALREITGDTLRPGGFQLTEKAVEWCGFTAGMRILDAGCGIGATAERLSDRYGLFAVGADGSRRLLAQNASSPARPPLLAAKIPRLPFKDAVFDGIFCECVLSLLTYPPKGLTTFHSLLATSGYLVLTDIYLREDTFVPREAMPSAETCLHGTMPLPTIVSMVTDAGFRVCLIEDHTDLLRELAVRLIFKFGSLSRFWQQTCAKPAADAACPALHPIRPGYYLLIARKD
jgi:arsenite methyltransferase